MTAVSFQMSRGVDGFKMSDVTVSNNAPASGDVEFRFNVLDILEAFKRWVLTNGTVVGGFQVTGITQQPSGPPN